MKKLIALAAVLAAGVATAEVKLYEYMTVTGTANVQASGVYTITDYIPKKDTVIRAKYSTSSVGTQNNNQFLFCSRIDTRDPGGLNFSYAANVGGKPRWDYNNSKLAPTFAYEANSAYELEIKNGIVTLTKEGASSPAATIGSGVEDFTPAYKLCFFQSYTMNGNAYAGFGNSFHGRFYYLKVFELEGGVEVLKHWYVPCAEDGVVKVCDLADDNKLWTLTTTDGGGANITGAPEVHLSMQEIHADYSIGEGKLNTSVTTKAQTYPVQTWFCCGATDGGYNLSAWDRVVEAGISTDKDVPFEEHRVVDFKYCRYYFPDIDNEVWSEPFELVLEPSATAQVTERRSTDAKIETVIDCCGGTNEVAAVYLAYAQKGEELPAYTLVETNVPTGKTVSVKVTGLTSLATYAYQVKVVNVDGGELVIPGEFDSRGQCYWEKTSFVPADWTSPEDRIPCRASPLYDNRVLRDQGQGNLNSNSVITCSWTEPKDIETIEVYTYGDRSWRLELLNVQVKFDGDEDYTLLTGSHLNYTEDPGTGVKLAVLHGSDGLVAQKVTSVKIQSGHWANGHASGIGELVFRGKTSGSEVKWDYRAVASADGFALPDDVLTNDLVKVSGFSANEKDADLTTETDEHEGKSWTWSFAKPHDIRTVELWGYGYPARSAFGIASVQYKRKGDEGWTKVVGSALELFSYDTNGHCAQLRGEKKWLLRDVTDLKLVLGEANNGYVLTAEVFCTGARSVHGLMMIVK